MTEQLFPDDMANGLVDGTTPAEAVPADLQATAALLRAAHQPASSEELSGMAAMVQAFTAEVAVAHPSTISRSHPMFATRITRRAATMVAVTLLAAGTAAAAAGGVLPTPFSGTSHTETIGTVLGSDTSLTGDTTDTGVDSTGVDGTETDGTETDGTGVDTTGVDSTSVDSTVTDGTEVSDGRGNGHEFKGLCTAWTNGAAKSADNPSFSRLKTAADAAGQTIDEFCVTVLANAGDDEGTDETEGTEPGDDNGGHGNSGNHGGGPSTSTPGGNGNGNNGNHGGASTSTPGEGHGGGNGNGNGGNGGNGNGGSHGGGDSNG